MRDILLITIVVISCLIALRRPVYGVLFFAFLGAFNPHSMTWGIARQLPLSQAAAIATLVGYCLWNEPKRFPSQREFVLLLTLWGTYGISTIFALSPNKALDALILVSKILLMIILAISILNTKDRINALIRVISFSLGFYAVKGAVFALITGGNFLVYGPEDSFLGANNSIGLAFAMNVPLLAYLLRIESRPWLRWIIKAMLVCSYPSVIFTYSRGAWLGLAMASGLLVLRSQQKFIAVSAAGLIAVILLSIAPAITPKRLTARYDSLVDYEDDSSAQSRFWNWEFCKRVGLSRPLTGAGFDYYSIKLYAVYYPEFLERWPGRSWSCHSIWLAMFSEHGIIGFGSWLTLIISTLVSLRRIRSISMNRADIAWASDCAEKVQIALVSFLIVGTFLDAAQFDLFYYLIGFTIMLKEQVRLAVEGRSVAQMKVLGAGLAVRNRTPAPIA